MSVYFCRQLITSNNLKQLLSASASAFYFIIKTKKISYSVVHDKNTLRSKSIQVFGMSLLPNLWYLNSNWNQNLCIMEFCVSHPCRGRCMSIINVYSHFFSIYMNTALVPSSALIDPNCSFMLMHSALQ